MGVLLTTQRGVGRCLVTCAARCWCKSPVVKWGNAVRVSKKHSLKPHTASHAGCRGAPRTPTQGGSPCYPGPGLQEMLLFGPPSWIAPTGH